MGIITMSNLCKTGAEHSPITDSHTQEICCINCGIVMSGDISISEEASTYENAKNNSQHYPVHYAMGEKGLGSVINKKGTNSQKLNYTNTRYIRIGIDQTKGLVEFRKISDKLALPEYVIEEATKSFIYIRKEGFLKGREINSIVGACVYLFSKKNGLNITFKEISEKLSINRQTLYSYYTDLVKILNIEFSEIKVSLPIDYFEQIYSKFNFDLKIKIKCLINIRYIQDKEFHAGKNPIAVCAAIIYNTCQDNFSYITLDGLSYACGISAVTIRKLSRKFKELDKR